MNNIFNIILHLIIILILITLFIYALYYINNYNKINNNLTNCNAIVSSKSNLLSSYNKLPIPIRSILINNLIIFVPVLLTYDSTGSKILSPITNNNNINVGLVNRTYGPNDYTWYITITTNNNNNQIVIMDNTKTKYIVYNDLSENGLLSLSTSPNNSTFIINSNNQSSSLSPSNNLLYNVIADNTSPNLLKLNTNITLNNNLYIINFAHDTS